METETDSGGATLWIDSNTASDDEFQCKYINTRKLVNDERSIRMKKYWKINHKKQTWQPVTNASSLLSGAAGAVSSTRLTSGLLITAHAFTSVEHPGPTCCSIQLPAFQN